MLRLIFHMSDVQIARTFFACIITDCPGASCWDDWSHNRPWLCPQTRHFSGYEQAKCLDISVVALLGHYLLHNIDLQGFFCSPPTGLSTVQEDESGGLNGYFFGSWPGHLKGRHIGEGLKWQRKDPGTNEGRAWYVYKFLLQPLALVCSMRNVDILLWTRIWNDLPP